MIWRKVIPDLHGLLWLLENGLKKKNRQSVKGFHKTSRIRTDTTEIKRHTCLQANENPYPTWSQYINETIILRFKHKHSACWFRNNTLFPWHSSWCSGLKAFPKLHIIISKGNMAGGGNKYSLTLEEKHLESNSVWANFLPSFTGGRDWTILSMKVS